MTDSLSCWLQRESLTHNNFIYWLLWCQLKSLKKAFTKVVNTTEDKTVLMKYHLCDSWLLIRVPESDMTGEKSNGRRCTRDNHLILLSVVMNTKLLFCSCFTGITIVCHNCAFLSLEVMATPVIGISKISHIYLHIFKQIHHNKGGQKERPVTSALKSQ